MDVVVSRHLCNGFGQGGGELRCCRLAARADVEAHDREIGHDVVGRSAFDFRGVDRDFGAGEFGQAQHQPGGRDDRIAALVRIAPGVRGAAVDDHAVIPAACAGARECAVGQRGRFECQRGGLACRESGDQRGG